MARPGRFELPTLCLEGRRSIQLSYGRTSCTDFKSFIGRYNTILAVSTLCREGRRSTKLSYGPVLPITRFQNVVDYGLNEVPLFVPDQAALAEDDEARVYFHVQKTDEVACDGR